MQGVGWASAPRVLRVSVLLVVQVNGRKERERAKRRGVCGGVRVWGARACSSRQRHASSESTSCDETRLAERRTKRATVRAVSGVDEEK